LRSDRPHICKDRHLKKKTSTEPIIILNGAEARAFRGYIYERLRAAERKPLGGSMELDKTRITGGTDCGLYRDMDTVTLTHIRRMI
jgi:hypothetical protein